MGLSRAFVLDVAEGIAKTHHRNFSEYGCRIIQLTVQEVAQSGFLGFPRIPDYLHASPVCANASLAHTAKAGKGIERFSRYLTFERYTLWLVRGDSPSHPHDA
ncbi:MAG: hypothetical protein ACYTXE_39275 [Nostoc sp.]